MVLTKRIVAAKLRERVTEQNYQAPPAKFARVVPNASVRAWVRACVLWFERKCVRNSLTGEPYGSMSEAKVVR